MRILFVIAFLVIASTGTLVKGQAATVTRSFERLDGPVASVATILPAALRELDADVRIRYSGDQLQVRIDRSVPEALLLQKLEDATGGPFRPLVLLLEQSEHPTNAGIADPLRSRELKVDIAGELIERPELLDKYGLPRRVVPATTEDREAHHLLVRTWVHEHPEHRVALLKDLLYDGNND